MVCIANGINVEGHSSDGDGRTRNAIYNRYRIPKNLNIKTDLMTNFDYVNLD